LLLNAEGLLTQFILVRQPELFPPLSHKFVLPKNPVNPSAISQIVQAPTKILDTYLISLTKNYYFPLVYDPLEIMDSEDIAERSPSAPPSPSRQLKEKPVTVEDSIDTITDILKEVEGEDPPIQTQTQNDAPNTQEAQTKVSFHRHRFSIYRKSSNGPIPNTSSSQLSLFKAFC
jgi:hypothetical protein